MRVRRYFGLDVGSSYEIRDGALHVRENFGNLSIRIPLAGATFKLERSGLFGWLLNFGDISVKKDGVEQHRLTGLFGCSQFHQALEAAAAGLIEETDNKNKAGIPPYTKFSRTAIVLPRLPYEIERAASRVNAGRELPIRMTEQYSWVERGQRIAKFEFSRPGLSILRDEVFLYAPCSGLVIVSMLPWGPPDGNFSFTIAAPMGEPEPLPTSTTHREFIDFVRKNLDRLTESLEGTDRDTTRNLIEESITRLASAEQTSLSLTEHFAEYLREMRYRQPFAYRLVTAVDA